MADNTTSTAAVPVPIERAAIFLMSIGEEQAAQVMKHLGAKDVQRLGQAMAAVKSVSREQAESVIDEFVTTLGNQTALGVANDEYVRKVLVGALGEDKAGALADRIFSGHNSKGLEALKWMETRAVADLVRNEHPQIIAIVLAYLDADQATEVLLQLPENVRADCLLRIATLDGVQPQALQELDEIMERQTTGGGVVKSSTMGGVKVAANIMNLLDSAEENRLMSQIRENDNALGGRIEDLMFVFDDLASLDDRSMQTLLRDVPTDKLTVALRGADPKVKEKITANLSKRAAEMLTEDMEAKGPVKIADVEIAQKEILATARKLADSGEIALGSANGENYV
ncbi:MAG TPA: flagellar motor switch protein FliG [Nevskiaceae bacterium]|nr:flagellar motor switch protein FliG [Nevskiaceae bacterium]